MMLKCRSLVTAGVLASALALCMTPAEAAPNVGQVETHSNHLPTEKTPKPKPKPTLKLIKSGAHVGLTEEQSGRQATRPPPPAKKKSGDSSKDSPIRPAADRKGVVPFRLNIGLCGRVGPDGTVPGPTRCQPFTPDQPEDPERPGGVVRPLPRPEDVTWEQILSEYKDVLFPGLGVEVQPKDRTLVNLDTVVYTGQSKVSVSSVTLLGFPVVVEATPMSYTWSFGDGKTITTTTPGKPYPSKEVSHKYLKRGDVRVTLTTNYAARYNVAGTGWQYVDGTVPIGGPATALLVREAVPVLVDPQR